MKNEFAQKQYANPPYDDGSTNLNMSLFSTVKDTLDRANDASRAILALRDRLLGPVGEGGNATDKVAPPTSALWEIKNACGATNLLLGRSAEAYREIVEALGLDD